MAADPALDAALRRRSSSAACGPRRDRRRLRAARGRDRRATRCAARRARRRRALARPSCRAAPRRRRPADRRDGPAVLVASDLGPADVAELDAAVVGIALAGGAPSAHAAVVARGLGIPMAVGLGAAVLSVAAARSWRSTAPPGPWSSILACPLAQRARRPGSARGGALGRAGRRRPAGGDARRAAHPRARQRGHARRGGGGSGGGRRGRRAPADGARASSTRPLAGRGRPPPRTRAAAGRARRPHRDRPRARLRRRQDAAVPARPPERGLALLLAHPAGWRRSCARSSRPARRAPARPAPARRVERRRSRRFALRVSRRRRRSGR